MWSHSAIALCCAALATGCGQGQGFGGSAISTPVDSPDLTLQAVAFARLSDGRMVARGTARSLDYHRQGGRLVADGASMTLEQQRGFASFGAMRLDARKVEGEVSGKRGTATGEVRLETARGDHARTDRVDYDGATVRSTTRVLGDGPGYKVRSNGLLARTDGSSVQLNGHVDGTLDVGVQP